MNLYQLYFALPYDEDFEYGDILLHDKKFTQEEFDVMATEAMDDKYIHQGGSEKDIEVANDYMIQHFGFKRIGCMKGDLYTLLMRMK